MEIKINSQLPNGVDWSSTNVVHLGDYKFRRTVDYTPKHKRVEYGEKWGEMESLALNRDGFKCQWCGFVEDEESKNFLQVHHIEPSSSGGKHDLKNLITLCNKCHKKIESLNWTSTINKMDNEERKKKREFWKTPRFIRVPRKIWDKNIKKFHKLWLQKQDKTE